MKHAAHHSASAASADASLYDYERALARLGGDPELFREVVALFLEDSPQLIARARSGVRDRDFPELARAAHSLKNLSATFDAQALTNAAAAVERHAHEGDMERVNAYFDDLEQELSRLQHALTAEPPSGSDDRA